MRILIFFIWIALGVVYFLIWSKRESCCDVSNSRHLLNGIDSPAVQPVPNTPSDKKNISSLNGPTIPPVADTIVKDEAGCVLFAWRKPEPIMKSCFAGWKDSIIKSMIPGQSLEIIGNYYEKENFNMAGGDLGLIRATQVKDSFQDTYLPSDRIILRSRPFSDPIEKPYTRFPAIQTKAVFMNDQVKELDDKTLIYFKYATSKQLNSGIVKLYADHLVRRLKNTDEEINIVGHTDDDATAEHNMALGLQRANLVKNLLITKGIQSSRIHTSSKGETEPISPNDTEENRKLNRRVELTIIPHSSN